MKRPAINPSHLAHPAWLAVIASLALSTLPKAAAARCAYPEAEVRWTYPDASTLSVPPDAVFWAVPALGTISVEVDGVALEPRGSDPLGRVQFVSAAPLAEGEHELVARSSFDLRIYEPDGDITNAERRVSFRVAAQPPSTGAVSISSVTIYPVAETIEPREQISPPESEHDIECTAQAIPFEWCNDILPSRLARIAYEPTGNPVAYVAQGNTIVPPGCASFWTAYDAELSDSGFRAAAVLPTGLGEEQVFSDAPEELTLEQIRPDLYGPDASSGCSMRHEQNTSGVLVTAVSLALAGWCAQRRRERARDVKRAEQPR